MLLVQGTHLENHQVKGLVLKIVLEYKSRSNTNLWPGLPNTPFFTGVWHFIPPPAIASVGSALPSFTDSLPRRLPSLSAAPPLFTQSSQPEPPAGAVNFIFYHFESTTAGRGGARQVNGCFQAPPCRAEAVWVDDARSYWDPS